jgi:hypothetical protein
MIQSALALSKMCTLKSFFTRKDMVAFIGAVKLTHDPQVLHMLLDFFNGIVGTRWTVSSSAKVHIDFPRADPQGPQCQNILTSHWIRNPCLTFCLPPMNPSNNQPMDLLHGNVFSFAMWLCPTTEQDPINPLHVLSIGSRRLALEIWLQQSSVVIRATTDVTIFGQTNIKKVGPYQARNIL